jgi:hypothetical protein
MCRPVLGHEAPARTLDNARFRSTVHTLKLDPLCSRQCPLETIAQAQERIAEEVLGAANNRTSSALAVARANSFLKSHNHDKPTEPHYTTQIQPQTLYLNA